MKKKRFKMDHLGSRLGRNFLKNNAERYFFENILETPTRTVKQKMHDLYATLHIPQMVLPDAFWAVWSHIFS